MPKQMKPFTFKVYLFMMNNFTKCKKQDKTQNFVNLEGNLKFPLPLFPFDTSFHAFLLPQLILVKAKVLFLHFIDFIISSLTIDIPSRYFNLCIKTYFIFLSVSTSHVIHRILSFFVWGHFKKKCLFCFGYFLWYPMGKNIY